MVHEYRHTTCTVGRKQLFVFKLSPIYGNWGTNEIILTAIKSFLIFLFMIQIVCGRNEMVERVN